MRVTNTVKLFIQNSLKNSILSESHKKTFRNSQKYFLRQNYSLSLSLSLSHSKAFKGLAKSLSYLKFLFKNFFQKTLYKALSALLEYWRNSLFFFRKIIFEMLKWELSILRVKHFFKFSQIKVLSHFLS
jgi:hypothetical protein